VSRERDERTLVYIRRSIALIERDLIERDLADDPNALAEEGTR